MSHNTTSKFEVSGSIKNDRDESKTIFGFWLYLMTDCVLFASLFATYAVLHNNVYGGASSADLFSLPYALIETLILLTSSFTCGLAVISAKFNKKNQTILLFSLTLLLGVMFLSLEINEFVKLAHDGNSWHKSGFLSSYFTLVGTHGLHITIGLIWMVTMLFRLTKKNIGISVMRQITMLSLFWHFLDVVWIFIFTIVYLYGGLAL